MTQAIQWHGWASVVIGSVSRLETEEQLARDMEALMGRKDPGLRAMIREATVATADVAGGISRRLPQESQPDLETRAREAVGLRGYP